MSPHIWTEAERAELSNLFHTARIALCGTGEPMTRYAQRCWASRKFHEAHPEVSETAAYKRLCRDDAWRF